MRTALRFTIICLACALLSHVPLPGIAAQQRDDQPRLTKIVALTRHGVRSPTQSAATANQADAPRPPRTPRQM